MSKLSLLAVNNRNFVGRRRALTKVAAGGMFVLLAAGVFTGCETRKPTHPTAAIAPGSSAQTSTPIPEASNIAVVDCLLPGHVRRLGGMVYAGQRRADRTSARDCAIRGGEYVLYDPANYATALNIWMPLAQQGDSTAQLYVGEIYERGLAGSPDYAEAAKWYRQAVTNGSSSAKVSLARLYEKGQGVERDVQKALNLYREAVGLDAPLKLIAAADLEGLQQEVQRQTRQSGALRQQVHQSSTDLVESRQRLDRLQKEAEEKQRALAEAREALAKVERAPAPRADAAPAETTASQERPERGQHDKEELAQREAKLEKLRAELRQRERALAEQAEAIGARAAAVASRETTVVKGTQDLAEARRVLESDRTAIEQARQETETQQTTLARERARIEAERDRLAAEVAAGAQIAEQQAALERENASLMRRQTELTQKVTVLDRRAAELDAREAEVQARVQAAAVSPTDGEREALARRHAEVEAERQRLAAELERLQQDVPDLQEAHRQQEEVIAGLQVATGDREKANAKLSALVNQYELEIDQNKKEIAILLQHIDILAEEKTPQAQVSPEVFGQYYALIIGNDDYKYGASLSNARFDARTVADILRTKYRYNVIEKYNTTRGDLLGTLNVLKAQLTDQDNLLIYYAGHGEIDKNTGAGYWLPVDAEPAPQTSNWISNVDITNILRDMKAKHVLVVADSCYGGSMTATSRPPSVPAVRDEDRIYWIKTLANKPARMVMTSGTLSPVLDGGGGNHSVFAKALVEVLGTNDNIMEGWRVYIQVAARVGDMTKALGHEQRPTYRSLELQQFEEGDYFFVPG